MRGVCGEHPKSPNERGLSNTYILFIHDDASILLLLVVAMPFWILENKRAPDPPVGRSVDPKKIRSVRTYKPELLARRSGVGKRSRRAALLRSCIIITIAHSRGSKQASHRRSMAAWQPEHACLPAHGWLSSLASKHCMHRIAIRVINGTDLDLNCPAVAAADPSTHACMHACMHA